MKFQTTKEKLLQAVLVVEKVVGKKETLPVLSCVFFKVTDKVALYASNLESQIEAVVPAEIDEVGEVAVPVAVLLQAVRSIGGDKVTLETKENGLRIFSKNSNTVVNSIPSDEFPVPQIESRKAKISIGREMLIRGIQSVLYSASPSMIRPELGSVLLRFSPNTLLCVATDSFRLAEKKTDITGDESQDILLPLRHTQEVLHILQNSKESSVMLGAEDAEFTLIESSLKYSSRVIDGNFPDYRAILPKEYVTEVVLIKSEFVDILRKARVFSNDQMVNMKVLVVKKECCISASNQSVGEMQDVLEGVCKGEDIDINFHISYLSDCVNGVQSDSIILRFAGVGRPLVVQGVHDDTFTYLVMPLNR